jgi:hypothetical protein
MPGNLPPELIEIGASKVAAAITAFNQLIQTFAGANVILQITASGKTELIGNAVKDVIYWGSTGSLWEAYKAAEAIQVTPDMAPFITEEIKQEFKNQIIQIISNL